MRLVLIVLAMVLFNIEVAFAQSESIESCCTGTANPRGSYGSTDLPRTTFVVTYNASGAKLQSPRVTLYLGVQCDAYSPQYGNGVWGWANGGTRVTFADGRAIGFPRQVLDPLIDRSKGRCSF
jgi:hypothetical protein